jgi:hypothetical protein
LRISSVSAWWVTGERSAVMSCAMNCPKVGQPAASRASRLRRIGREAAVAAAEHPQELVLRRECRKLGEEPAVAAGVDRRIDRAAECETVIADVVGGHAPRLVDGGRAAPP